MFFIYPIFVFTFLLLVYLVYEDIKTREINIIPVLVLSVIGLLYNLYFGFLYGFWKMYLLQLFVAIIFVVIIYILGKVTVYAYIGEGDLFVLLMLSFTTGYSLIFSEIVFILALFLTLLVPFILFIYNLFKKNYNDYLFKKNFLILFLGYPINVSKLNDKFTSLENYVIYNKKLQRKITLIPKCNSEEEIQFIKNLAKENKIKKIWVSPLIPFILPLCLAYVFLICLLFFFKINILNLVFI